MFNHSLLMGSSSLHFGSEGSQPGQLDQPLGICIDTTDTVYVTDENHRVSAFSRNGKFLKCFGKRGTELGEQME